MKWIRTQEEAIPHFKSSVLTIGSYDGVHLGHQKLLQTLVQLARENNTDSVAITFKPHPRTVLRPQEPHQRLFDYKDQVEMMSALGVSFLVEEKFSKDFSMMSAEEFLEQYVAKIFKPVHIVVGHDFNFGRSRAGNIESLKEYCKEKKIGLTVVEAYKMNSEIVSSSRIRQFLIDGDVKQAAELLGRPYYLRGPVRVGYKRGRTIGVPTANISPEIEFVPRRGVYFSKTTLFGKQYCSITNIGFNPTFENSDAYIKVETHIFNFNQEIYGEHMKVELEKFHRDEKKFSAVEDLKKQISEDFSAAKKYFGII